jgi:NAD(P)-dependent dehydrogenase (short-subunit alcohol dehydrogenase family)
MMKHLNGKVAVVTGGAGGIGRGMALAFAEAGMRVAIADIDERALEETAAELADRGGDVLATPVDVSKLASVTAMADQVFERFGETHLLCNNAGVSTFAMMDDLTEEDWCWVLGVNLAGVSNGLLAFLPRMKGQRGEKHIVNTASIAGMVALPLLGPYIASKYAVVGISEALRIEGGGYGLSCSVLCPGSVNTGIVASARNRPDALGGPSHEVNPIVQAGIDRGMDPVDVGRIVRQAVIDDDPYIFTHIEQRPAVEARIAEIHRCYEKTRERVGA